MFRQTLATLCFAALCSFPATVLAQANTADRGIGSESFLRNLKQSASSDNFRRNLLHRDRSAISGFGVKNIEAPSSTPQAPARPPRRAGTSPILQSPVGSSPLGLNSPPRSQSASFGISVGSGGKPFQNVSSSPTVSPYLGLFREDLSGYDDLNYQTSVKPRLQQQAFNDQIARQAQALNRQLTAISARNAYEIKGSQNMAPTGHAASFQYYSRFYPAKNPRQQRRTRR